MGDGMVYSLTLLVEDGIGKVIVLVNDKVKSQLPAFSLQVNERQLGISILRIVYTGYELFRVDIIIVIHKIVELCTAVDIEVLLHTVYGTSHLREVEV